MTVTNSAQTPVFSQVAKRVGAGEQHSFFGYYNKSNFSLDDTRLLANRVPMMTGDLTGTETAEVGYYDLANGGAFHKLGETSAWNWQMGCQLQWLGQQNKVIFNTRASNPSLAPSNMNSDFRSTILDVETGETRELPLPVYVVAPNGRFALSVNYSRFWITHRTIGYAPTSTALPLELAPAEDGITWMDLETGEARLVVSLADLRNFQPLPSMDRALHWVTHLEVNPSGTRFLFIHRWTERVEDEMCFLHRLFSMNADGSGLRLHECTDHPLPQLAADFDPNAMGIFDYEKSEYQISHPMWKSDEEIIVWGPHDGAIHYHLYNDVTGDVQIVGDGVLTENGHMTYSTDGRWILSDTYPDKVTDKRILFLFDTQTGTRHDLGDYYTPPDLGKHNRCDLHPRWSRDNQQICFDSVHEGSRQLYLLDVSDFVAKA